MEWGNKMYLLSSRPTSRERVVESLCTGGGLIDKTCFGLPSGETSTGKHPKELQFNGGIDTAGETDVNIKAAATP